MDFIVVATITGKHGPQFLRNDWQVGEGTEWAWTDDLTSAHRFTQVSYAAEMASRSQEGNSITNLRIEQFEKIKTEINFRAQTTGHYIIRESRFRENKILEYNVFLFSFAEMQMAEHFLLTQVAALKANGYTESYRHQSDDDKYVDAVHVTKDKDLVKTEIMAVRFVA